MEYQVNGEVIPMVSSYKYLGFVVDEHLKLKEMVEEKAAAGRRALGAWMNRCKAEVGDVGVGTLHINLHSCLQLNQIPFSVLGTQTTTFGQHLNAYCKI